LSRRPARVGALCGTGVAAMATLDEWDADRVFDAVINLAGAPIADKAWSDKRKQQLLDSRVRLTAMLVGKIAAARVAPRVLLSGSAIGYYGSRQDEELDESACAGSGFAAALCVAWEQAALAAAAHGVRVCLLRTGLVLSARGGILAKMRLPLGMGMRLGDGRQWMSWIHIDDYVQICLRLLEDQQASGAYNLTAPEPVSNQAFTRALVGRQGGWMLPPLPALCLKLMLGERAGLLLQGQRVLPHKIRLGGYRFIHPDLPGALCALLPKGRGA